MRSIDELCTNLLKFLLCTWFVSNVVTLIHEVRGENAMIAAAELKGERAIRTVVALLETDAAIAIAEINAFITE